MSKIEINIRQSGTLPGTSKWLADQVANAEFRIGKNLRGNFTIFVKWENDSDEKILAFKPDTFDEKWRHSYHEWQMGWAIRLCSRNDEDFSGEMATSFNESMTVGARRSYYDLVQNLISEAQKIIANDNVIRLYEKPMIKTEEYVMIDTDQFWKEYQSGRHQRPKTLVIHGDEIDFAYVINGHFDHSRQGVIFKKPITKVLVKKEETNFNK